jgi:predicted secreted Zn-dependent protease
MTNYQIFVTWEMAQSFGICRMRNVVVHLEVVYTYPQWLRSDSPEPQAVVEWDRFETYVREHEERHGEIAQECAQELTEQMESFEPGGSCMAAQENLDALVSDLYEQCEARQQAFDDEEGRTTFPLP